MGKIQDFIHAGTAAGIPVEDTVRALLTGVTGAPPPVRDILKGCGNDHALLLSIASAAMQILDDVPTVAAALIELGIHPLSLFFSPQWMKFNKWLNEHPQHKQWFHEGEGNPRIDHAFGILRFAHLKPSVWLRSLEPDLKLVLRRPVKVTLFEDTYLTRLLSPDSCLGSLEIRASRGVARLPSRVPGNLQLLFNEATFLFPKRMEVRGRMAIHGCSGIHSLPEELRVEQLIVEQCPSLRQLPRQFHDLSHLDVVGVSITSFPPGVSGLRYLRLTSVPGLKTLTLSYLIAQSPPWLGACYSGFPGTRRLV